VVNNKRQFTAIEVGPLAAQFCGDNPGLSRCKDPAVTAALDAAAAAAAAAAGGNAGAQGGQCD
jgi:hypothetical protein